MKRRYLLCERELLMQGCAREARRGGRLWRATAWRFVLALMAMLAVLVADVAWSKPEGPGNGDSPQAKAQAHLKRAESFRRDARESTDRLR